MKSSLDHCDRQVRGTPDRATISFFSSVAAYHRSMRVEKESVFRSGTPEQRRKRSTMPLVKVFFSLCGSDAIVPSLNSDAAKERALSNAARNAAGPSIGCSPSSAS